MSIVKNLVMDFKGSYLYVTNIFDLHIFDKEKEVFLKLLETSWNFFARKFILFLYFFLDEISNTNSLLIIHLERTFVHFGNLNSSFISKQCLNYGLLNMLSGVFLVLFFNLKLLIWFYYRVCRNSVVPMCISQRIFVMTDQSLT